MTREEMIEQLQKEFPNIDRGVIEFHTDNLLAVGGVPILMYENLIGAVQEILKNVDKRA